MKPFLKSLRALIAAGSIAGFLGAWALLGHAGKTIPVQAPPPIVAPAPLPGVTPDNNAPPILQPLPALPQPSLGVRPRLRTGGS